MPDVEPAAFEQFFFELHGRSPFPGQTRLASLVCERGWPKVLDLPTASGKTACLDVALFALAVCGDRAPRRIFFVVDRRVIVSEAHERACRIACKLRTAGTGVVRAVAENFRALAGGDEPLETRELRGGAFRDESWVRSPLQPMVIATTVDQAGSRILFRGYGVSEGTWPIHAGLLANDSLILVDEAHCSKPFAKTLAAIEKYRGGTWASSPLPTPFHFVEMTATPSRSSAPEERFVIGPEDRSHVVLRQRLLALKPVRLPEPVACRKNDAGNFASALIQHAIELADEAAASRVAIMVNRIRTAKQVHQQLRKAGYNALLVIGRMRPIDRDSVGGEWKPLKTGEPRPEGGPRSFVVSTQCLEVGADLDFDVLVSECASIDALQQRFGRLDRAGEFGRARGAVLAASWQLNEGEWDPVYGHALRETWGFLCSIAEAGHVNFGVESEPDGRQTVSERVRALPPAEREALVLETEDAPFLLPSHLDALVQPSPRPAPEPFGESFRPGNRRGPRDVYVVWRAEREASSPGSWEEIIRLCPPSTLEAMPVSLWAFRRWFDGTAFEDESDLETATPTDSGPQGQAAPKAVVIWRGGEEAKFAASASAVYPGATVVLPSSSDSWGVLGFKPAGCAADRGDEARARLRRRVCLRLHPGILAEWPECPERGALEKLVSDRNAEPDDIWAALESYPEQLRAPTLTDTWGWLDRDSLSAYPSGSGWFVEGYYGESPSKRGRPVLLETHLDDVKRAVDSVAGERLAAGLKQAIVTAAGYHDFGKADLRFQAWLRNGDTLAARFAPKPLAKSARSTLRTQASCGLPENFRHELVSLLFAAKDDSLDPGTRDLVLHLIACHHGRCRPFAPVVIDEAVGCVDFGGARLCRDDQLGAPAHALDSGVPERFWLLTRQFGWWGLAYLEAMLRMADWRASGEKGSEVSE